MNEKKRFLDYIKEQKKYSINTVQAYEKDLELFLGFLNSKKIFNLKQCRYEQIREYVFYLHTQKKIIKRYVET